jgi:hypothetical protein
VWKSILIELLDLLLARLEPQPVSTSSVTVTADPLPELTAGLNLATEGAKLVAELQQEANSPDEVKAATAKKRLAAIDALVQAQSCNNLKAEQEAAENA